MLHIRFPQTGYGGLVPRVLADFPPSSDLPASFHSAAAAVPDLVVQVDRGTHVAWHYPDFLSDPGRPTRLHVAVFLIQFAHGPRAPDDVPEGSGANRLIAGERL